MGTNDDRDDMELTLVVFTDDAGNQVDVEVATRAVIKEFDYDGSLVKTTYARIF